MITPFLPGDSPLFAVLLCVTAIVGDTVDYRIGHYISPKAFRGDSRWLKKKYLDKTTSVTFRS